MPSRLGRGADPRTESTSASSQRARSLYLAPFNFVHLAGARRRRRCILSSSPPSRDRAGRDHNPLAARGSFTPAGCSAMTELLASADPCRARRGLGSASCTSARRKRGGASSSTRSELAITALPTPSESACPRRHRLVVVVSTEACSGPQRRACDRSDGRCQWNSHRELSPRPSEVTWPAPSTAAPRCEGYSTKRSERSWRVSPRKARAVRFVTAKYPGVVWTTASSSRGSDPVPPVAAEWPFTRPQLRSLLHTTLVKSSRPSGAGRTGVVVVPGDVQLHGCTKMIPIGQWLIHQQGSRLWHFYLCRPFWFINHGNDTKC
jgi:hypothetical protein